MKPKDHICLKTGSKIILIKLDDLLYICACGNYSEFYHINKKYVIREPISSILKKYPKPNVFIRIHKSTIINIRHFAELNRLKYGDLVVTMSDGKKFRVSKTYKKELLRKLNTLG